MSNASSISFESADVLWGAKEISVFLFGTERKVRQVYYLVESKRLPTFKLGSRGICARRSTLTNLMCGQEGGGL